MLKQFFIICSGADTDILEHCSKGEQNKYAGIGATVFFTAIMACIAASYALNTVFNTILPSMFFGLIWSLLIFNLDRYIVSTLKKSERFSVECIQASPRIVLAIIIAVTISKPLELKIFEKEINQVLLEKQHTLTLANKQQIATQYSPDINDLKNKIVTLNQEISEKETVVNNLYNTYIAEAEGTAGTKRLGKGPVYQEKRDKHDALLAELNQLKAKNHLKISDIESQISNLEDAFKQQLKNTQPVIDNFDGLMARISALNQLPWLPSFFIFLLFLTIETAPILAKLLSPKSAYDLKLEDAETAIKTHVKQNIYQRNLMLKTNHAMNDKIYQDIEHDATLYAYKHKKSQVIMQLQADAFYNQQKNAL
ncbi:DUF4407 domain-containing protein [Tamlana fucoidanivorans]|uniref:DUF4407 domain-containing protein n=1 Tax=Allotamlana fucoidanivorans TaxID=2583814 RepID=A0A5C4SML0_9FLAO|nr:DUF4407 domain-containing protein [Tamlana fucoidanivorans]TNJ45225.1 DUF4407 domain-containing protein [Tamlana fucoidanivorans]